MEDIIYKNDSERLGTRMEKKERHFWKTSADVKER